MLSKKNISIYLSIIFLGIFGYYFYSNWQDFNFLGSLNPVYLILTVGAHFVIVFLNGLLTKWIIEPYGKKMGIIESYYLSLYASIGNFFLPIGSGLAMRAFYLKQNLKLNYKNYMTTLYGNYMIVFLCNGVFGLFALIFLRNISGDSSSYKMLLIVFSVMAASTLILTLHLLPVKLISKIGKKMGTFGKKIIDVINGWDIVAKRKDLLIKMIIVTIGGFVALFAVNFFAVKALGVETSFWALVLYTAIGSLALLMNVTPGSLGIKESLYILSSAALGLSVPQILSISVIDRGSKFIVLVGGWMLMYTGILPGAKDFRKKLTNRENRKA